MRLISQDRLYGAVERLTLLCRLYDPTRGSITWDGVDLRDMDPADLRRRIGVVFQDFMHYDLSAHENIALGDLSALGDEARIRAAARSNTIDAALASLPHGYDTLLSRTFSSAIRTTPRPASCCQVANGSGSRSPVPSYGTSRTS